MQTVSSTVFARATNPNDVDMRLLFDSDSVYRWYNIAGEDLEISAPTIQEALDRAETALRIDYFKRTGTIADQIAAAAGDDGRRWYLKYDLTLDDGRRFLAGTYFVEVLRAVATSTDQRPDDSGITRYTFADGSVIVPAGDGWDLGYPDCFCWQGAGHEPKSCLLTA